MLCKLREARRVADLKSLWGMAKTLIRALTRPKLKPEAQDSIGALLVRNAQQYGDQPALVCEGETVSWRTLNQRANRIAARLATVGIQRGDCVALMMENRTEFIPCLLGINKLGAVAGLLNAQQRGSVLTHSLSIVHARALIVGAECADAITQVQSELAALDLAGRQFVVADPAHASLPEAARDAINLRTAWAAPLSSLDATLPDADRPETLGIQLQDACFYIFTSGTTGLPKAAIFGNHRFFNGGYAFGRICLNARPTDRIYVCLPLYHATALTTGLGSAMLTGCSIALKRKFSASSFFDDIRREQCTAFAYIGELCRYLLSQPERTDDARQPAAQCVGNGLRPDIWKRFKQRFGIREVYEFYGASEGNSVFLNAFNKDETMGFSPLPYRVLRYDIERDEIIRNDNGLCIDVGKGEAGLLVNAISADARFEGYTNKSANEAKLVRNVAKLGDLYFNTGDLIRFVDVGYTFGQRHTQFVDRLGDTFRWHGENCSTNEIAEVLQQFPQLAQANVYGVQIPGTEGRAGMAAINLAIGYTATNFDWLGFTAHVRRGLASYAQPVFIRVQDEANTTSTFKLLKGALKEQAYHPDKTGGDPVYVLLPKGERYVPMDAASYAAVMSGETRF